MKIRPRVVPASVEFAGLRTFRDLAVALAASPDVSG